MEYKLVKSPRGNKFLYEVQDENGNVVSMRQSERDYVACTIDGSYYFGRLDLIGKGEHGQRVSMAKRIINSPKKEYETRVSYFVPSYRAEWRRQNPYEEWLKANTIWAEQVLSRPIAYLVP